MSKYFYTWEKFEFGCKVLYDQIKKDGFRPLQIIAITRGGLFVAGLISQYMDRTIPIETVGVKSYHGDKQQSMKLYKVQTSDEPVLICDDVVDTGLTMKKVKELYPKGRIAVLHYKSENKPAIKPDYFAEDTNEWVVYPWEVNEK